MGLCAPDLRWLPPSMSIGSPSLGSNTGQDLSKCPKRFRKRMEKRFPKVPKWSATISKTAKWAKVVQCFPTIVTKWGKESCNAPGPTILAMPPGAKRCPQCPDPTRSCHQTTSERASQKKTFCASCVSQTPLACITLYPKVVSRVSHCVSIFLCCLISNSDGPRNETNVLEIHDFLWCNRQPIAWQQCSLE